MTLETTPAGSGSRFAVLHLVAPVAGNASGRPYYNHNLPTDEGPGSVTGEQTDPARKAGGGSPDREGRTFNQDSTPSGDGINLAIEDDGTTLRQRQGKRRRPQATSGTLRGLFEAAGVTLPARRPSEDGGGGGSLQQDGDGKRPRSPGGTARGHILDVLKHGLLKRRAEAWGG